MSESKDKKTPSVNQKIRDRQFQRSDHFTTRWSAVLPSDHEFDFIKDPGYWSIIAKSVSIDDIFEIRSEDQRFYAEAYVLNANRYEVVLKVLRYFDLQDEETGLTDDSIYEYAYKGPAWKHCVIRIKDGFPVAKNLATKADALQWIAVHSRNAA